MKRRVLILITVAAAIRIALAVAIGLGVDESYEVVVSRALSLSYLDHPPLSFWIARLAAGMTASEYRLWLRLPFILTFALTTWFMYRLTTRFYGERAGFIAACLLNVMPVFSLTGGWILPDIPLDCALLGAGLCLARVIQQAPDQRDGRWLFACGLAAGLALLSKYHAVFFLMGTLAYLATQPTQRAWLRRPEPYGAAGIALLMFLPVLVWNAQHNFASFRFQAGRSLPSSANAVQSLGQNLAGQAGYLLPWLWAALVYELYRAARKGPTDAGRWLFFCLAVGPIAVFTLVSLGGAPGLPHWPAPGYLFLIPLFAATLAQRERRGSREVRQVRHLLVITATFFLTITIVAATHASTGWLARIAPSLFRRGDPSLEVLDWAELRPELESRGLLPRSAPVGATHWIEAAKIGYALGPDWPVVCLSADPRHFAYFNPPAAFLGKDILVLARVDPNASVDEIGAGIATLFRSVEWVTVLPIHRGGAVAFNVAAYRGRELIRLP